MSYSPVTSFQQVVTTAPLPLAAHTFNDGVVITALSTNTGTVFVGGAGVSTTSGYPLAPGQSISYGSTNSSLVFIVGQNTSDAVAVTGS